MKYLSTTMQEITTTLTSICPICQQSRSYKSRQGLLKGLKKPCRACTNSIKQGGSGLSYDEAGIRLCRNCSVSMTKGTYYEYNKTICKSCSHTVTAEYIRSTYKFKKYSIDQEQYNELLVKQGDACAICKTSFDDNTTTRIDHDHITGEVRGLLCHYCNVGLGHFKDNIEFLTESIKYLKTNGSK